MKATFERALHNFALAAAAGLLSTTFLYGRIGQDSSTGSQAAPSSQIQKADQPSPPQALNGMWKLNAGQSDDPEEKMKGTNTLDLPNGGGNIPAGGQNAPSAGGRRSGGAGGAGGRSGGAGPLGGPIGGGGDIKGGEKALELLRPSMSLTVEEKESEFDLTDEQGRKRAFFTDGRKLRKSKDKSYQEMAALWSAGRLTFDEKGPEGEKISSAFQLTRDARQLIETIEVDYSRVYTPVMIRYVYDPAPAGK